MARVWLVFTELTGMARQQLTTLWKIWLPPHAAAIEQRCHRRRGGHRQPGTRGGDFRQKITDRDRILVTILYQRCICDLRTLAELSAISGSTPGTRSTVFPGHPRRP